MVVSGESLYIVLHYIGKCRFAVANVPIQVGFPISSTLVRLSGLATSPCWAANQNEAIS